MHRANVLQPAASVAGDVTSVAVSLATAATSVGGSLVGDGKGVFETVTSTFGLFESVAPQLLTTNMTQGVGASVVTIVTSAGGKGITLAASEATAAASNITSFFHSATAAAATSTQSVFLPASHVLAHSHFRSSNAASHMGALAGLSAPLCASLVTIVAGISLGAWAIV